MTMTGPIRLNIGAGERNLPGFIPLDGKQGHDATRLDYPNGSVDEIYSSHCLEHIHHRSTLATLAEWVRVLKPGGRIRIAVPDFDRVFDEYQSGKMHVEMLKCWLHGSNDVDHDRHRTITTADNLIEMLKRLGIEDIKPFQPEINDCTRLPLSLNISGYKRQVHIPREPKVVMVLSTPRVGFVDPYPGIIETARDLGWAYQPWGGTEWGKGLTMAIVKAIKDHNPDYIMCLDYDSVFDADDCRKMLKLMQDNPDVGAIYPVEAHRHGDVPLGFDTGGTVVYRGELTQVASGHFGCTMLRRQIFNDLPHPWFFSMPNPETGLWAENNVDADIAFWVMISGHGWNTCQANNVQIGHLELCVKWLKPDGATWQPIQNYRKNGKPPNAKFDGEYWESKNRVAEIRAAQKKAEEVKKPSSAFESPNPEPSGPSIIERNAEYAMNNGS